LTSTSAPPPPPPPQPHIGDKDKQVDASALDIFNAPDTLAGEMNPTPSTSSDLDQGGDGDVGLAEMPKSPSVSGASSLYAASEQTGLTSWHASEGCRSEAGTWMILRTHSAGHSRKRSTCENYGHLGSGSCRVFRWRRSDQVSICCYRYIQSSLHFEGRRLWSNCIPPTLSHNFKYTYSIEIVPICKDDLVCIPLKQARTLNNITSALPWATSYNSSILKPYKHATFHLQSTGKRHSILSHQSPILWSSRYWTSMWIALDKRADMSWPMLKLLWQARSIPPEATMAWLTMA